MESIIVHIKNPMESAAVKNVLKEMGIKYEKFHTRNSNAKPSKGNFESKVTKPSKSTKPKGL